MRKASRALMLAIAAAALPAVAQAQMGMKPFHWGPEATYQLNQLNYFALGVRGEYSLAKAIPSVPQLRAMGSFDYYFANSGFTVWQLNLDVAYQFPMAGSTPVKPYAGAGFNHYNVSCSGCVGSASSNGLNILGGVQFKPIGSGITPFVEARLELQSGGAFALRGGILF